jgi:hypothetical protein
VRRMKTSVEQKLPAEIKLEQKRSELASLRARHFEARVTLQQLRDEIAQFEKEYDQTLGRRMAELERIEAEIARLSAGANNEDRQDEGSSWDTGGRSFRQSYASGNERAGATNHQQSNSAGYQKDSATGHQQGAATGYAERPWKSEEQDIKSLYREVAKAIHPDLASAGPAKLVRHELMSKANRAYADEDSRTLQDILRKWRVTHPAERGDNGNELATLLRQIAREAQDLRAVNAAVQELKESYACRFMLRLDAGSTLESDLFVEMIAVADLNIERALKRLAVLKLEVEKWQDPILQRQRQTRYISFPSELSCGTLYLRARSSQNYSHWKKYALATGSVEVDIDKAVRLDVKEQSIATLSHFRKLKSYDLQSLYLYDLCDRDLESILHLTGLEELYLSGARFSDAALLAISSLTNLKRIYIYQTSISDRGLLYLQRLPSLTALTSSGNSITDQGLAGFQLAVPKVKTVNFQWKR